MIEIKACFINEIDYVVNFPCVLDLLCTQHNFEKRKLIVLVSIVNTYSVPAWPTRIYGSEVDV